MNWKAVENKHDLEELDSLNCWEDSETIEFYGLVANEKYFPNDISRSGWENKNIHVLVSADCPKGTQIELVLIDCDYYDANYIENIHFSGTIDRLKRVEIIDYKGSLRMRCSRIIYRLLVLDEPLKNRYFKNG